MEMTKNSYCSILNIIGTPDAKRCTPNKEKTIMLIGATGTGKSTLVDGFVNYVMGVNWTDLFRFTVVDLEEEEKTREKNQVITSCHITINKISIINLKVLLDVLFFCIFSI